MVRTISPSQGTLPYSPTEKRYTCVHPTCLPNSSNFPTYYSTWTALQHHTRTAHPPSCSYASCNNRTFASQHGLRAHLKLHEQSEKEIELNDAIAENEGDDGDYDERPKKKRRGGELGRDWKCGVEGCMKDFKSVSLPSTTTSVSLNFAPETSSDNA